MLFCREVLRAAADRATVGRFQVHLEVSSWFVQDQLRGDPVTELRVKFVKRLEDSVPPGED